jgi:hypothetical protein
MADDDNIQDVDFEEVTEDKKNIRGSVLYYSTSQVSTLLNQPDSKIRYYTSVFDDILKIQISNKQRRYTEQDIEKLKFIIELKNEGMTIKQIQEYAQEVDFNAENGKIQIKESNPLSIQALAKALMEEQEKQILLFKQQVIDEVSLQLKNQLEVIKINNEMITNTLTERVAITVDEVVSEKLETNLTEVKTHIDQSTEKTNQLHQDNKKILEEIALDMTEMKEINNKLKEILDNPETKEKLVKSVKKENDGWISRIAKKFNK